MNYKNYTIFILVAVSFILAGCPVSTSFPLGEKSSALKYDNTLEGTWTNNNQESEANVILIDKGTVANTYRITVKEKGTMFMAETDVFDAWLSELNGMKFLVLQEVHAGTVKNVFYVYHIKTGQNEITSSDVTLKVGGTDAVTSVEKYREEVKASTKYTDFLQSPMVWQKE